MDKIEIYKVNKYFCRCCLEKIKKVNLKNHIITKKHLFNSKIYDCEMHNEELIKNNTTPEQYELYKSGILN